MQKQAAKLVCKVQSDGPHCHVTPDLPFEGARSVHVVGERRLHLEVGVVHPTEGHRQRYVGVKHVRHARCFDVEVVHVSRPHLHRGGGGRRRTLEVPRKHFPRKGAAADRARTNATYGGARSPLRVKSSSNDWSFFRLSNRKQNSRMGVDDEPGGSEFNKIRVSARKTRPIEYGRCRFRNFKAIRVGAS